MPAPSLLDLRVECGRFQGGLSTNGIAMVVSLSHGRRPQVNDGRISAQLRVTCRSEIGPQLVFSPGPVSQSVQRSTIAKQQCRLLFLDNQPFHFTLHVEDRALRGLASGRRLAAPKPAAEHNAGCLGEDGDVLAEIPPGDFQHRGLSAAWPASENDQRRMAMVEPRALAAIVVHTAVGCNENTRSDAPLFAANSVPPLLDCLISRRSRASHV